MATGTVSNELINAICNVKKIGDINLTEYINDIIKNLNLDDMGIIPKELVTYNNSSISTSGGSNDFSTGFLPNIENITDRIVNEVIDIMNVNGTDFNVFQEKFQDFFSVFGNSFSAITSGLTNLNSLNIGETNVKTSYTVSSFDNSKSYSNDYSNDITVNGKYTISSLTQIVNREGIVIGSLSSGTYTIYEVLKDSNGKIIRIRISKDGEQEKWINVSFDNSIIGTDIKLESGLKIVNKAGVIIGTTTNKNYTIYDVERDSLGNIVKIRISKDGDPEEWIIVNVNEPSNISVGNTLHLTGVNNVIGKDGQIIRQIGDGDYTVYEVKKDMLGNIVKVRISKDGEPEEWIQVKIEPKLNIEGSKYLLNANKPIYDSQGNVIGTTKNSEYTVYAVRRNNLGKIEAIRISKDGDPEEWVKVIDDLEPSIIGSKIPINNNISVVDSNGNKVGTLNNGDYTIYEYKLDNNGNIIAVRISKNGEPEQWITLQNGVPIEASLPSNNVNPNQPAPSNNSNQPNNNSNNNSQNPNNNGTQNNDVSPVIDKYELREKSAFIVDDEGNIIGTINRGEYNVYDVLRDENGNIIAYRINENGDNEWLYLDQSSIIPKGSDMYNIPSFGNSGSFLKKYSGTLKVGGAIGILVIAAGATAAYVKNKKGEKVSDVPEGEYNVYSYEEDDYGKITQAKISPPDQENEYWIQF